jgi:hypothetical protein
MTNAKNPAHIHHVPIVSIALLSDESKSEQKRPSSQDEGRLDSMRSQTFAMPAKVSLATWVARAPGQLF